MRSLLKFNVKRRTYKKNAKKEPDGLYVALFSARLVKILGQ